MKYFCILFLFTISLSSSLNNTLANVAQPGIWNAGGTVYSMLYPEDSLTFKKVQMLEENIFIQLYKGYAVVKGAYIFRNTTEEKLNFKMGYPVNSVYYGGDDKLNQIRIDSLNQFKIQSNNTWINVIEQAVENVDSYKKINENWKVWQMYFSPNETKTVQVYFIVNTNNARISEGYNNERKNAFIYLLESGKIWRQPIEKGKFYVQMMDGMSIKDIHGIAKGFDFLYNKNERIYAGTKTNFSPTPNDNLIVTYHKYNEKFSLDKINTPFEELYARIDEMSMIPFEKTVFSDTKIKDPYAVKTTLLGIFPALLTSFVLYAPIVIGIVTLLIIVWAVLKWNKIRRNKNTK